jgi:Ni/Co efflux regulator RcnB
MRQYSVDFLTSVSMNKLLLSLLSVVALGLPVASEAQAPAMPTTPVAQPDQATPNNTKAAPEAPARADNKAKKAKKKKLKKKKSKKAKAH